MLAGGGLPLGGVPNSHLKWARPHIKEGQSQPVCVLPSLPEEPDSPRCGAADFLTRPQHQRHPWPVFVISLSHPAQPGTLDLAAGSHVAQGEPPSWNLLARV